jgi:release factor glutamine methyltransferase
MNRVYLASEDSFLLRRVLRRFSGQTCLEIGAGNGGNLLELAKSFGFAVGTDIVPPEMPSGGGEFVLADRASCFRDSVFDLVAFNPPYLPSEEVEDAAVDGGRDGVDATVAFLEEAVRVVKATGTILILLSSQNPMERIELICREHGLTMTLEESERLFYESLAVYSIRRAPQKVASTHR